MTGKAKHSGACQGYRCTCREAVPLAGRTAGGWVYCACGHTVQVHATVDDSQPT